jgi:hypothetical protein
MLTFGELQKDPKRIKEVAGADVLVLGELETVVQTARQAPQATMVFEHETMKMMMAERAEKLEKLRSLLDAKAAILPLRKKDGSFWDHITLGRASTADIVINDPAISNVHAHFEQDDESGGVALQDLGSSNGTFVNREPLQPHLPVPVRNGDVVRVGQTIFYYVGHATLMRLVGLEK